MQLFPSEEHPGLHLTQMRHLHRHLVVDAPPPPPKMPLCPNDPLALCPLDDAKLLAQLRRSAEKQLEKDPNFFKDIKEGRYKAQPQPPPGPSRPIPTDQPTATGIPSSAGKEFWIGEDDPAGMPDQPGDQASAAPEVPPVHPDAHLPGWYPEWKEDMIKQRDAMIEGKISSPLPYPADDPVLHTVLEIGNSPHVATSISCSHTTFSFCWPSTVYFYKYYPSLPSPYQEERSEKTGYDMLEL